MMKQIKIDTQFSSIHLSELSEQEQTLIKASKEASFNAYAPYSKFHVGASLLIEDGEIILGNNQENAAFPSGLCAERVALFHFGSRNSNKTIKAIAICAQNTSGKFTDDFIVPCGGCLQVMSEYQMKQKEKIKVFLYRADEEVMLGEGIENFLPLQFILKK